MRRETDDIAIVKPHEARFAGCGHENRPHIRGLIDSLTWYVTDEWTVSVLHSEWGWEACAWPTSPSDARRLTDEPVVFNTEAEALAYRDSVFAGVVDTPPTDPARSEVEGSST